MFSHGIETNYGMFVHSFVEVYCCILFSVTVPGEGPVMMWVKNGSGDEQNSIVGYSVWLFAHDPN